MKLKKTRGETQVALQQRIDGAPTDDVGWMEWNDYNKTLLRTLFEGDDVPNEYARAGVAAAIAGPRRNWRTGETRNSQADVIESKLRALRSIIGRIELAEESSAVPSSNLSAPAYIAGDGGAGGSSSGVGRGGNGGAGGSVNFAQPPAPDTKPRQNPVLDVPEKLTLAWLYAHMPLSGWIVLCSIVTGAFSLGMWIENLRHEARVVLRAERSMENEPTEASKNRVPAKSADSLRTNTSSESLAAERHDPAVHSVEQAQPRPNTQRAPE